MKVELKTILAGPDGGGQPGQEVDLEDARARELIKAGYAVEVKANEAEQAPPAEDKPEVETATSEPEEAAVGTRQRRKPRKPRQGAADE
ncbi:MAG TPA: hypothetical protein VK971_02145 [Thiohalobacter sp.]|nr:hypothetical protein [Thiohalobacter sp.]